MAMFRKLPAVVEAEQFTGTADSVVRVAKLAGDYEPSTCDNPEMAMAVHADMQLAILTSGQWLVKMRKGAFDVMTDEEFRRSYAKA